MVHGIRVVGVELVHDEYFSRVTANLAVLVGEPGARGTRFDEQFNLRQLARNVGVRDVWFAPTDVKCQKFPKSTQPGAGLLRSKSGTRF